MAYSAIAIPVMIASPGDVSEERNLIRDIIHDWNDIHSVERKHVLMPVGWETHSSPDLGGRPQSLINKNVLEQCDLLVGVFWTRIGTPTGEAESGTAEEIRKHVDAGKPAMVYFSTAPVAPETLDPKQYSALKIFKDWCKGKGLIEEYDNISSFSEKFHRHLQIIIRDNTYLRSLQQNLSQGISNSETEIVFGLDKNIEDDSKIGENHIELSVEAQRLLIEAVKDKNSQIISVRYLSGQAIQTNNINFADSGDRRSIARWEAALGQLIDYDLVKPIGYKNQIFEVTDKGYKLADILQSHTA